MPAAGRGRVPVSVARVMEFLRFCVVGGASSAASMLSMYLLTDVAGLNYRVGFVLTFLGINLASFLASDRFVFQANGAAGRAAMLRYYGLNGAVGVFNLAALTFCVDVLGLWHMAALLGLTALNAPLNYFLHRNVTFRVGQTPAATGHPSDSWQARTPADPS